MHLGCWRSPLRTPERWKLQFHRWIKSQLPAPQHTQWCGFVDRCSRCAFLLVQGHLQKLVQQLYHWQLVSKIARCMKYEVLFCCKHVWIILETCFQPQWKGQDKNIRWPVRDSSSRGVHSQQARFSPHAARAFRRRSTRLWQPKWVAANCWVVKAI